MAQDVQSTEATQATIASSSDADPEARIDMSVFARTSQPSTKEAPPSACTVTPSGCARECRICLTTDDQADIVQPCACLGSVRWAHVTCLKAWCMERLSLKCEICGGVYKEEVVSALMVTLLEAQDRSIVAQGFAQLRMQARSDHPVQAVIEAERRVRAPTVSLGRASREDLHTFLEDLVHFHAARRERLLAAHNSAAFRREDLQNRRRPLAFLYACVTLLIIGNIALWIVYGRSFCDDGAGAGRCVALFLIPALTVLTLISFMRRRAAAAAAATAAGPNAVVGNPAVGAATSPADQARLAQPPEQQGAGVRRPGPRLQMWPWAPTAASA